MLCVLEILFSSLRIIFTHINNNLKNHSYTELKKIGRQCVHLSSAELCLAYSLIIKQVKHYLISEVRCYDNIVRALSINFCILKTSKKCVSCIQPISF